MKSSFSIFALWVTMGVAPLAPVMVYGDETGAGSSLQWQQWVDAAPPLMQEMEHALPLNPLADFYRITKLISDGETPFQLRLQLVARDDPQSPFRHLGGGFRETASEITVAGKTLEIRSETVVGLAGGIYKLLEDWGCRWVLPGELGEVLPSRGKLALADGTRLVTLGSDVAFGGSSAKGEAGIWNLRNRAFPANGLACTHFWLKGLEPQTYFASHPEYYALVDGQRTPTQPETVHPEVIRLKVEHAKAYFRNYPNARSYPMDPEDNSFFSEAPEAMALDPEGVGRDGLPLMTDRVIAFCNAVREGLKEEFPDRMVGFYSYLNHSQPPVRQKVDPNTVVGVTRFGYCTFRLVPGAADDSAAEFEKLVGEWLEHTEHVYVYDYNPPPWAGALPFPTYRTMAESMRRLKRMGVKGFYSDVPYGASFAPGVFVNTYLRRRMMVEPDQDPARLMEEYCKGFFGNAGGVMQRYYETMESVVGAPLPGRKAVGVSIYRYDELFPRETVAKASLLLSQAQAMEVPPLIRKRLELVAMGHEYLVTYLSAVDAIKAGDDETAQKQFQAVRRNLVKQDRMMSGLAKFDDAERRMKALQATLEAEHFPAKRGALTEWELTRLIPRREVSADQELGIFTEPGRGWKLHRLKTGIVDFNALLRGDLREQPLSKAFARCKITVPEEQEVVLRYGGFYPGRLYVNGERVINLTGPAFFSPDMLQRKVKLKKGVNTFWVVGDEMARSTVDNPMSDGIQWSFTLAIQDAQGRPLAFSR